jgi:hypothetical protein
LNALADMLLGWALHESSNPKYTAWLTGIAEGLLAEADIVGRIDVRYRGLSRRCGSSLNMSTYRLNATFGGFLESAWESI